MKKCRDYAKWTHDDYADAGCAGCEFFFIFADGDFECKMGWLQKREEVKTSLFGLTELVVRDYGEEDIKKSD